MIFIFEKQSIAYLCMNVHSQSTMDGLHASSQPIEYFKYVKFCTFPNIKYIHKCQCKCWSEVFQRCFSVFNVIRSEWKCSTDLHHVHTWTSNWWFVNKPYIILEHKSPSRIPYMHSTEYAAWGAHLYNVSIKVTSLLAFENINLRQDQDYGWICWKLAKYNFFEFPLF